MDAPRSPFCGVLTASAERFFPTDNPDIFGRRKRAGVAALSSFRQRPMPAFLEFPEENFSACTHERPRRSVSLKTRGEYFHF